MSGVRVLVGTRKGAFILTSDGKRDHWNITGPFFGGWEIYHLKGSPADPNRLYASQSTGWFGQLIQRSNDGGKTWEPVGNQFAYEGVPGHAQVVRRHAASVGIRARVAPRAVAGQSGSDLRGRAGRRDVQVGRRRRVVARAARAAPARDRVEVAAGRGRAVSAHDPDRSDETRADVHRDLRRRRVQVGRRRTHLAADQPRTQVERHSRSRRARRPLRAPARDASHASKRVVYAETLGRDAERRRR